MVQTLLVVGWDAATLAHLQRFELPFYDSLSHGSVLQPEPYWQNREVNSGAAWTTITTGLSMWDHRVATLSGLIESPAQLRYLSKIDRLIPRNLLDTPARIWFRRLALGAQPTNDDIPYKRTWHYIPDSLSAFVPLTYPPKPTEGVTVSGFPSPEVLVEPKELTEEVRNRYDGEPQRKFDDGGIRDGYIGNLYECHDQRVETIEWLSGKQEFRLVFVVFTLLDRLLHVIEDENPEIRNAYERIDSSTQRLVENIDPDDVLIISDHGMKYSPRWKWKHIHDETAGIWAGTSNFELSTHLDVTPAVVSFFDREMGNPSYQASTEDMDTTEMEQRLEDLGYL